MNFSRRRSRGVHTLRTRAVRRDGPQQRPRIALYSHDAQGLGHIRRNLAIAKALSPLNADILLLTGAPEAADLRRTDGIDIVAIPALAKDSDGQYSARHLGLDLTATLQLRQDILRAALASFAPDLLIVDKHVRGFKGELEAALAVCRRTPTRVVLGLRDVLDEAEVARAEWRADDGDAALRAYYDEVWLYGDPTVHNDADVLNLHAPVRATGYLASGRVPSPETVRRPRSLGTEPYVLGLLGGGSDGTELAYAFARARFPDGHRGVLITGPHLPAPARRAVRDLARTRPELSVHTFRDDIEHWYAGASAIVSMGGYNTVCEALAAERPLLVVPRVTPRAEQLVRARGLQERGALDVCHPDDLDSESLTSWFARTMAAGNEPGHRRHGLDLNGLRRIPAMAASLLGLQEVAHSA
ncbi:MAG TPA: glycosyltransferase [Beutenbergiaceae bacterium]|nr:glycosyltransferase [Beutenbergiaceae bacterium]